MTLQISEGEDGYSRGDNEEGGTQGEANGSEHCRTDESSFQFFGLAKSLHSRQQYFTGLSPQTTMTVAEHLYVSGYISYPRTETTSYPPNFDLTGTLRMQANDSKWGNIARNVGFLKFYPEKC